MSNPIQDGRFYGQVAVSRRLGDLVLSETTYEAGAVVPWHAHESPLVCLVLRGALEEFTARGHRRFPGGALFYHPRHEPHAHRFEPPGVRCFTLILGAGLLRRLEGYAPLALPGPTDVTASPAAWLARQLHAEFRRGAGGSDLVLEGLALAILGELSRGPAPRAASGRPKWIETIRALADAGRDGPVSLMELAAEVGVHPVHVARTFRRVFGCSVGEHVRRRRIEQARQALLATDLPLASIGLAAGFSDQAHFCRQFKAATGLTPGAYRAAGRQTRV